MIEKIFSIAKVLLYCYVYLYGIKTLFAITNDMQAYLLVCWTAIWCSILVKVNWEEKKDEIVQLKKIVDNYMRYNPRG